MLTRIPYYKEIVLSSFECSHCDFKNNQLDPACEIKQQGVRLSLKIEHKDDLDRYIITTDYTSMQVKELDFEMPPMSQKSQVTTIEGILTKTITNLTDQKKVMEHLDSNMASKMEDVIHGLIGIKNLTNPIQMVINVVFKQNLIITHAFIFLDI